MIGISLLYTGDLTRGLTHLDRAIALYEPAEHRALALRFGQDTRAASLSCRSFPSAHLTAPLLLFRQSLLERDLEFVVCSNRPTTTRLCDSLIPALVSVAAPDGLPAISKIQPRTTFSPAFHRVAPVASADAASSFISALAFPLFPQWAFAMDSWNSAYRRNTAHAVLPLIVSEFPSRNRPSR
jgi:hypothetical protein